MRGKAGGLLRPITETVSSSFRTSLRATVSHAPPTPTIKIVVKDEEPEGFTPRTDSLAALKDAFDEDRVKVVGKTKVGKTPAYQIQVDLTGRDGLSTSKIDYYVDVNKFKPLLVKFDIKQKVLGVDAVSTSTQRYLLYELLQPTKKNLELLKLDNHPGATVDRAR